MGQVDKARVVERVRNLCASIGLPIKDVAVSEIPVVGGKSMYIVVAKYLTIQISGLAFPNDENVEEALIRSFSIDAISRSMPEGAYVRNGYVAYHIWKDDFVVAAILTQPFFSSLRSLFVATGIRIAGFWSGVYELLRKGVSNA